MDRRFFIKAIPMAGVAGTVGSGKGLLKAMATEKPVHNDRQLSAFWGLRKKRHRLFPIFR